MKVYRLAVAALALCLLASGSAHAQGLFSRKSSHQHDSHRIAPAGHRVYQGGYGDACGCEAPALETECCEPAPRCCICIPRILPAIAKRIDNTLNCLFRCAPRSCEPTCCEAPVEPGCCGATGGELMPVYEETIPSNVTPPQPPREARRTSARTQRTEAAPSVMRTPTQAPQLTPAAEPSLAPASVRRTSYEAPAEKLIVELPAKKAEAKTTKKATSNLPQNPLRGN